MFLSSVFILCRARVASSTMRIQVKVVGSEGFEPPTPRFVVLYSVQLNYEPKLDPAYRHAGIP